jgi:hypothetical protein
MNILLTLFLTAIIAIGTFVSGVILVKWSSSMLGKAVKNFKIPSADDKQNNSKWTVPEEYNPFLKG